MKRIAVLTFNHAAFFELGCALELFALSRPDIPNWYECEVITFDEKPLSFLGGVSLTCQKISQLNEYDMLIVPSWFANNTPIPEPMASEIQRFHQAGNTVISFCSGAFLLANLGLLNDYPATTHWGYADKFKALFPNIEYVDDVLYVLNDNIGCSAGSSAAIDLGIEIIRQDYGHAIANKVARRMVLSAHRKGGQTQFADNPVTIIDNQFSQTLDWALNNLSTIVEVGQLASRANMSRRSFDRKFKNDYQITPKQWLTFQRLNTAKEYLETSDYSVEKIAEITGFNNATTMRHHFRKELGISPTAHRERFYKT